ncbi:MAG: hypothetical protein ABL995_13610 [Bryobacteraceae bacterium]
MRQFVVPALFLSLAAYPLQAAIDPALLDLTPPGTKVLVGMNVEQSMQSSFGQFALSKLPENHDLQQFIAATGFDFRRDLRQILIASDGSNSPTTGRALVSVRGRFQPGKVMGIAGLSGAKSTDYGGIAVVNFGAVNQQVSTGAFLDADTLVLGNEDVVKAAIDQRASGTHYMGALAKKAQDASGQYDIWVATTAPLSSFTLPQLGGLPGGAAGAALSSILAAAAGIRFDADGANVTGELIAASSQDAQSLAGMAQLILALAQSSKAQGAQQGAALLKSARVSSDGSSVRLQLMIPEQQLEQMLNTPSTRKITQPAQ